MSGIRVFDDPKKQFQYLIHRGVAEHKVLGFVMPQTFKQLYDIEKELKCLKEKPYSCPSFSCVGSLLPAVKGIQMETV